MKLAFPPGDTFDPESVTWVTDDADLQMLLAAIETASTVVLDLENTGLKERERAKTITKIVGRGKKRGPVEVVIGCDARIVLASLTLPQADDPDPTQPTTWVVPLSHPDSPWRSSWPQVITVIAQAVKDTKAPLENQNVKYDCRWIKAHTDVDLTHKISWDTMLGGHLLDENSSTKLKEMTPRYIPGVERWDDFDLDTPGAAERVPLEQLGLYAARDTYWTWRLGIWQRELMYVDRTADDEPPYFSEEIVMARLGDLSRWCVMPQCATLTAMEQRGFKLDVEWVVEHQAEFTEIVQARRESLISRYPALDPEGASFAPTANWFRAWTEEAVKAGDLRVTSTTKRGKPQWNKAVLVRQARNGSQVADELLELRGYSKKLEYLASWMKEVAPDGRIYAKYNQGSVVTGRLSSSEPNMQQVTASLKPAFIPDEGKVVIELDYSQIELRIAAFVSRCEPMIQAYRDGKDLHRMMAAQIVNTKLEAEWHAIWGNDISMPESERITPEGVSAVERQAGKAGNFGLLYDMRPAGFRDYAEVNYGVSFTMEEAILVHRAFFDLWDGLAQWHRRVGLLASKNEQVTSPIGRVRRLPDINGPDNYLAAEAYRKAINSPVQGFASDLMQMAAASIQGYMPRVPAIRDAELLGTVHDSIVLQAPVERWEKVARQAQAYMVELVPRLLKRIGCDFDVPLAADVKAGTRWGLADVGHF